MSAALALGDDALVLSHRLGEWAGHAPVLEEDVALANIALDLLGQARVLLSLVGDEDELAYLREERAFRNLQLVEQPNGDFAHTIARQLYFSVYQHLLYERLAVGAASSRTSRRRPSRRSPTTATTPSSGSCGSGTAPPRAISGCRPAWRRSGASPERCSSRSKGWTTPAPASTGRSWSAPGSPPSPAPWSGPR
ncbi:hypothetical protein Smic_38830 [Streptomyces microflavus]|uniref:Phenylacetate-CoA oxygenase, PaaI subunit n=1 Tax=Streptomyces microflavus TaxID=1919 RepID=A0A7J0CU64_STRMI|nr:hypothetical protein Smic_38830 [Streptomyces microflavus]